MKKFLTVIAIFAISFMQNGFAQESKTVQSSLAKKVKLSLAPVYQEYCPIQKASWLSNNKAIKNPNYGIAMITCGSVQATLYL